MLKIIVCDLSASAAVNSGVSSTSGSSAAAAGAGYAAGALYGGTYYDEQLCRGSLPHHMVSATGDRSIIDLSLSVVIF